MYLELNNVRKSYGQGSGTTQALRGIDLGVDQGEVVVILGPSGCGKSTLLNVIGGLDTVDSGSIVVDDILVSELDPTRLANYRQENLGFVFQHYNLVPDLTVRENIELCEYLSDRPLPMNELLDVLGMRGLEDRFPSEMSGGQQQRTALARALIKNPKLLLCDEPTGALDTQTSKDILVLLERVNLTFGTTILMVTHAVPISKMAHRIIRMRDGMVTRNLINEERIAAEEIRL